MKPSIDGPSSPQFRPLPFRGGVPLGSLAGEAISKEMAEALPNAPRGRCVSWGIPYSIGRIVPVTGKPVAVSFEPVTAPWLVFVHTSDRPPSQHEERGFVQHTRGPGVLGEHVADYVVVYADGSEECLPIRRRLQVSAFQHQYGEACFEAVSHLKPHPLRAHHEQPHLRWGRSQTRCDASSEGAWLNWLFAWRNPRPRARIAGLRLVPRGGMVVLCALACGTASAHPLRWEARRKALLRLPKGIDFDPHLDETGQLAQMRIDMGQIISAEPRKVYDNAAWEQGYNNQLPEVSSREIMLEYTAHADARLHLRRGKTIPLSRLSAMPKGGTIREIRSPTRAVEIRVVEKGTGKLLPVKLHIHGSAGEYLPPIDRHRIINTAWFEDYGAEYANAGVHSCTYISGQATVYLPVGTVYVEIAKGFEIEPIRKTIRISAGTRAITFEIERVLPWRQKGWISADTHVHFLSPSTALLEGAAEGVNIVNLLASQWGELMTNVGDFDGKTTWGSRSAGGDGEYLVRVGSENRQRVLGHISLLGYQGSLITPMTTGGPDESAIGDPIGMILTEWAERCRRQGGLVVLPHFPFPRAENVVSIVSGLVDGIEMTSWGNLYRGINPYSLADWYRYLNCGYLTAAVGGTDKMNAATAVGSIRTYANLHTGGGAFTYEEWLDAVRRAETFVTYGPLLEFTVEVSPMGSRLKMKRTGGTVSVEWEAASVTVPMTRVELVVNGGTRESAAVKPWQDRGGWSVPVHESSWLALLVRGHHPQKPEIILAHTSPVMVDVERTRLYCPLDAVTMLEQIEGTLVYFDTVGTRADTRSYRRMRLIMESAHRRIHNELHRNGFFHEHSRKIVHSHA